MPAQERSDEALFIAWRDGGEGEALADLFRRRADEAYRLALRTCARAEDAEDAVSEAFAAVMRSARTFREDESFRTWLAGITVRSAITIGRSQRRRARREKRAARAHPTGGKEEEMNGLERDEAAAAAQKALRHLPDDLRAAVALRCVENLPRREAARALGVSERTVSTRTEQGLARLRRDLSAGGFASLAMPAAVAAIQAVPVPSAPTALVASLGKLALAGPAAGTAGGVASAASLAGGAAAAAKGGIMMKAVAAVVVAGTVAGAVAVSTGDLFSAGGGEPATVNPYKGMQTREEVFEFTRKPAVKKEGDKYVISFASKAKCDATVSIVDGEDRIVRHLASGVLGANAPHPFQQNTLSQKVEWDGLTDGFKKAPDGCRARVSLGLKAEFERDIGWDPVPGTYIEKDGKYFRTFWPPPAETPEAKWTELGFKFATTTWGDKVPFAGWYAPYHIRYANKPPKDLPKTKAVLEPLFVGKEPSRKADFENRPGKAWYGGNPRMAVDPVREELYVISPGGTPGGVLIRLDGKTGGLDESWYGGGDRKKGSIMNIVEVDVGPDGLVYAAGGPFGYLRWIVRFDHDGKPVPFPEKAEAIPAESLKKGWWDKAPNTVTSPAGDPRALTSLLATGVGGHSNVHDKGFDVSPNGHIVTIVEFPAAEWAAKHGLTGNLKNRFVQVWSPDGKLLSKEAVPRAGNLGHGVRMDRDGNLYLAHSITIPVGQTMPDGITDVKVGYRTFGGHGSLVKYRGLGDKFPLGVGPGVKVSSRGASKGEKELAGGLWAYGGLTDQMVPDCSCNHSRFDLDGWARSWIPARQLCSIMVLDANGNRIARLGRYGNVDDEGLRFAWARAMAASDTALYALDYGNRRILKAALSYETEETVPLAGGASASAPASKPTASTSAKPETETSTPPPARTERTPDEVCRGWLSLARSYARAGRKDKAREYLQKIIEEYPESEYTAQARKELAKL